MNIYDLFRFKELSTNENVEKLNKNNIKHISIPDATIRFHHYRPRLKSEQYNGSRFKRYDKSNTSKKYRENSNESSQETSFTKPDEYQL